MPYDGLHIARGPKIKFDSYFQLEINLVLVCNDLKMPSSNVLLWLKKVKQIIQNAKNRFLSI